MPPRKDQAKDKTEETAAVATVNGGPPAAAVPLDMRSAADVGADWLGQSTAIEAARAAAEVQAMVVVAQRMQRTETTSWERLERSCGHRAMADVAFYSYPRGGKTITGPTVKLAREALRCWGNAQSGIIELRRVDARPGHPGYSEMQAWAWDLETNVRESSTFIAPHVRERAEDKGGVVWLEDEDVRDIREANASMAGRVEREMIKRILPPWFMGMAEDTCRHTLIGKPDEFPARVDQCVKKFAVLGVPVDALEDLRGLPRVGWGPPDLMALAVIYNEIDRSERTIADVFPGVTGRGRSAADHLAKAAQDTEPPAAGADTPPAGEARQGASGPPEGDPGHGNQGASPSPPPGPDVPPDNPENADPVEEQRQADLRALQALFAEHKWGGRAQAHRVVRSGMVILALAGTDQAVTGRLASLDSLTAGQAALGRSRVQEWVAYRVTRGEGEAVHDAMAAHVESHLGGKGETA